jgi:hypothetical protein
MKNGIGRAIFLVALWSAFAGQATAQVLYGSLVGNVTDSTGGAIPGATVTTTQTETNLTREVVTNAAGAYSIPNIPSGTYHVVVTVPGFKTFTASNVIVTNRDVRVDAKLELGALQESVSVSATAAILQTENAAVQQLTTSEQIQTLPTSGRAFASFLTLMPGVAQPDYVQAGGINNPGRTMSVSINGQPNTNTVVRLDGATATNQYFQNIQSYSPGLEAIETVNVVTSSFDADQGMAGGASVNVQVKSGTNTRHGSTFEYGNDARLRARAHFLPAGQSKGTSSVHVFGGTIGGPIVHNKFFFFLSDESTRERTLGGNPPLPGIGTTGYVSLPTSALRRGDFSQTGTVIYDPSTGTSTGTGRTPFAFSNCPGMTSTTDPGFAACNFVPASRINSIAAAMLAKLVQPTLPGFTNNYFATTGYDTTYHKLDGKLTYAPGPKLNLNARFGWLPSWERQTSILPPADGSSFNPLSQGREWHSRVNSHAVSATSILSPSFVVDGLFAFTKHNVHVFPPEHQCAGDIVGIPHACQPPNSLDTAFPNFNVTGWLLNSLSQVRDYVDPQWQAVGNAGWTKGTHSVKFGIDYSNLHQNHYETQVQDFTFNGGSTSLSGGTAPNSFNRFADFLLGLPSARSAQAMTPLIGETASGAASGAGNMFRPATLRSWQMGTYVRDQWQMNQKMTASVGLRWEYYSLPGRKDHGIEVYSFTTNKLMICGVGPNAPTCGITVEKNLFTPRLGWAYRPTEKMVLRVGYSRNPQSDNPGRQQLPPSQAFPQTVIITQTAPNSFSSVGSLSEGSPVVPILDISSGVFSLPAGAGVNTFQDAYIRGKITSFNVSLQRAISQRMSAQIAYVANRQDGMTRLKNLNYGQLGGGAASQPLQPLGITSAMNVQAHDGKVHYDSMQLSVNRRMTNGFQFTAAYTYSKTINWWVTSIPIPEYASLNKGETGTPHKLNASLIYELPFGSGRKWVSNDTVLSNIVGGWQVNSFLSAQSGTLVNVTSNSNVLNAPGTTTQFADKVKDGAVQIFGVATPTGQYFDVSAFRSVTQVRFGNAGLGSFRGPTAPNLDMSLFRTFRIGRDRTVQFRAECFNVTNTVHYANPAANISNVTFNADGSIQALNGVGSITDVVRTGRQYDEREWRFGLRLGF